jgi:ABC-type sugar transport system substrate-binding protein
MKRVGLLFDDEQNSYQQLLAEEARSAARQHGIELLEPSFARGSVVQQIGQCYELMRADPAPDGVLLLLVAPDDMESSVERLAKRGVDCVFLNRVPAYLESLSQRFPERLLASVAPEQTEIGRIQGRQCLRLLPEGGLVVLIRGASASPSAVSRELGFREVVGDQVSIHVITGRWQEARAEKALDDWLRFRAGAGELDLVVSQNDAMARGARRALRRHSPEGEATGLAAIPILGCDGLPEEGQEMLRQGELSATVAMPPTSSRAIEILAAWWSQGEVLREATLLPSSLPPVGQLEPLRRAPRAYHATRRS